MTIKLKLKILQFLQFFIWGSWLITAGSYMGATLHFTGWQIGSVYGALGLASLLMPSLLGIVSDKWIAPNRLYILCHSVVALTFFIVPFAKSYYFFYAIMLVNLLAYMPTIAMSYAICYSCFEKEKQDAVTHFPPIRIWGTIGFIIAMWTISFMGLRTNSGQFYVSALAAILLAVFVAIAIPYIPTSKEEEVLDENKAEEASVEAKKGGFIKAFGLDAFVLFKDPKMAFFLIFSMLLGAILQISNTWADPFIGSFAALPEFANSLAVKYPTILVSFSQMSEVVFILFVPFFLKKFGIKYVMLISMLAWFLRFGFFAFGDPSAFGMLLLILSMIVYGCAFDFFNVSGSLYVEKSVPSSIRNSAQGLFMSLTNGVGALFGSYAAGAVVDKFSVYEAGNLLSRDWRSIWLAFAAYALVLAIVFFFVFKDEKKEIGK